MRRTLAALIALTALLAAASAAPTPKDESPYFPTRVGAKWVYRTGEEGEEVRVVTAVEDKGGAKLVSVGLVKDGKVTPETEEVSVSEKGLYVVGGKGKKLDRPICLLKLPHEPGDKWELDFGFDGVSFKGTATAREPEWVEVPAGKYRAVPVEMRYAVQGNSRQTTVWYARGVGTVKEVVGSKERVLKSFTPGKD
jgi:hypothetical protein